MFVTNVSIAFFEQKWSETEKHCGHSINLYLKNFHEHTVLMDSLKLGARLNSKKHNWKFSREDRRGMIDIGLDEIS